MCFQQVKMTTMIAWNIKYSNLGCIPTTYRTIPFYDNALAQTGYDKSYEIVVKKCNVNRNKMERKPND